MGHSRSRQGLHSTCLWMTATSGLKGPVATSSVDPNTATSGTPQCRRQVHGARIVPQKQPAPGQHADEGGERGPSHQESGSPFHPLPDPDRNRRLRAGAQEHDLGAHLLDQPIGHLGVALREPPLGGTEGRSRIQPHQGPAAVGARLAEQGVGRLQLRPGGRDADVGPERGVFQVVDGRDARLEQQIQIVVGLVAAKVLDPGTNALSQQEPPSVGGIADPVRDARRQRQQRRFEGVLKKDCRVESPKPPSHTEDSPHPQGPVREREHVIRHALSFEDRSHPFPGPEESTGPAAAAGAAPSGPPAT